MHARTHTSSVLNEALARVASFEFIFGHDLDCSVKLDTMLVVYVAELLVLILTCSLHDFALVTCIAYRGIRLCVHPLALAIALILLPLNGASWVHVYYTTSCPIDDGLRLALNPRLMLLRFLAYLCGDICFAHISIISHKVV